MTRYVVDASVAFAWLIPHPYSPQARTPFAHDMLAPEFLLIEVASAVVKRLRKGEVTSTEAVDLFDDLTDAPIALHRAAPLSTAALRIAIDHGRSVYDSLYVALALRERCQLVTADGPLYNALASHLPDTMLSVHDLPGAEA